MNYIQKIPLLSDWSFQNLAGSGSHQMLGETFNRNLNRQKLERVYQGLIKYLSIRQRLDFSMITLDPMSRSWLNKKSMNFFSILRLDSVRDTKRTIHLAPSDYHLFKSIKQSLRNIQFTNIQHIRKWVGDFFPPNPQRSTIQAVA